MEILQDDYETVGGLVTNLRPRSSKGEEVKYEGLTFKVLRADQRRSHLLRIIKNKINRKQMAKRTVKSQITTPNLVQATLCGSISFFFFRNSIMANCFFFNNLVSLPFEKYWKN